jgi:bifunctional non-homologous end joining protein LigD
VGLDEYHRKRNFSITPEPRGSEGTERRQGRQFVIQKHAATRLHYDFRLELNGVLLSWAVPKGPSLDPNDKRLAMHVEDHPLEYGDFEGVIPAKQYGAGTVLVWDRGTWTPLGDPAATYAKGHLKFELAGEKLRGVWNLVKSRSGKYGESGWLLFKEADEHARLGAQARIVDDRPDSVLSGRSLDDIRARPGRVWHSNRPVAENVPRESAPAPRPARKARTLATGKVEGARKAPLPETIEAQLPSAVKAPPAGDAWVHEIKHDGYRMLCRVADREVRMYSRNGNDWTGDFGPVARALAALPVRSAWLDGEVVVTDAEGRSSFQGLQNALSQGDAAPLRYYAFDLLYLDGVDLRGATLLDRKRLLETLLRDAPAMLRYSEHFRVPGATFLENVRALGLEGMVSKRGDLPYQPGRSAAWQKAKCLRRQEMVIGGYTVPEGSRPGFGALLLGCYAPDGRLRYAGKVGTGFTLAMLDDMSRTLEALRQPHSPFHDPPQGAEGRRARWVAPTLVAEVAFTQWTEDNILRNAAFVGLRTDKPAREVVREGTMREVMPEGTTRDGSSPTPARPSAKPSALKAPAADANGVAGVALTHPDKLLYREAGLTLRDLATYYATIGEWMLPHLHARPLTLVRCPDGWNGKSFYQKNADVGMPRAIELVAVPGGDHHLMVTSVAALVALLQMGALELHPWGASAGRLEYADRLVFDLDPDESLPWDHLVQSVTVVRTLLTSIGLPAFLKTTGGKGLHVVVPIEPTLRWDHVKGFTKAVAELLERTFPDRFTSRLLKVSRGGRIFIDYLRNAEGSTAIGAYSLRAKAHAPVSTPISWEELAQDVRYAYFNARNVPERLARLARDPWAGMAASAVPLTPAIMAKVGYRPE